MTGNGDSFLPDGKGADRQAIIQAMAPQRTHAECCAILEIGTAATPDEVRRGYQRVAMLWHPDRFERDSVLWAEAQEKIKAINEAYRFLQDHPRPQRPPAAPRPEADPLPPRGFPWVRAGGLVAVAGLAWALVGPFRGAPAPAPDPGAKAESPLPAAPPGEPGPAQVETRPQTPPLVVDRAALVIFWPSQKELDDAPGPKAAEIAQFLESARKVQEKVQKVRPEVEVRLTDAEIIQVQGVMVRRSGTCGYGYIVFAPPRRQVLLQGMQEINKMVECVCENFPPQDVSTRTE